MGGTWLHREMKRGAGWPGKPADDTGNVEARTARLIGRYRKVKQTQQEQASKRAAHPPRLRMARAACCLAGSVPQRSTSTSRGMAPAPAHVKGHTEILMKHWQHKDKQGRGELQRHTHCAGRLPRLKVIKQTVLPQGSPLEPRCAPTALCLTSAGNEALRLAAVGRQVGEGRRRCFLEQGCLVHFQHPSQAVDGPKLGCLYLVRLCLM